MKKAFQDMHETTVGALLEGLALLPKSNRDTLVAYVTANSLDVPAGRLSYSQALTREASEAGWAATTAHEAGGAK